MGKIYSFLLIAALVLFIMPAAYATVLDTSRAVRDTLPAETLADAQQEKWKGCGGNCDSSCAELLRPSENSVMNDQYEWLEKRNEPGWKAFNPPSEAQLVEKLNAYS